MADLLKMPRAPSLLFLKTAALLPGCLDESGRTGGEVGRASPQPAPQTPQPDSGSVTNDAEGEAFAAEGEGEPPEPVVDQCATVDPQYLDFGRVEVGRTASQSVALFNCGRAEASVRSLGLDAPDTFTLDGPDPCDALMRTCNLNAVIPSAGQLRFNIRYTPDNSGREGGRALIDFRTPAQILGVNLTGEGFLSEGSGYSIALSWSATQGNNPNLPDLDLHLLRAPGNWNQAPADCYFANANPDWGAPGAANNPELQDDCNGFGCSSENITLDQPEAEAVYRIGVHYRFAQGGMPEARIAIYSGGILRYEASRILEEPGSFWEVVRLAEEEGGIRPIDLIYPQVPLP